MCSKLASVCGILSKVRYVLDRKSLMLIYNSLVESRLRYGSLSWGTASNQLIDRLKVLQNRALRYIDFSPIGTTILPIYAQYKVLPLHQLIDLQRATYNICTLLSLMYFHTLISSLVPLIHSLSSIYS